MKSLKVFLLLAIFSLCLAGPVYAYYQKTTPEAWENSVYNSQELNLESHTNETFDNLAVSVSQSILGPFDENLRKELGGGALGAASTLMVKLYNPPVSSVEYFADLGRTLGVKSAYAQGIGFSGLSNLLPLWKATRNVAYLFFVIIFIFTGLAIMFRVKIDPKTAVTIQNAIPKLVIALILVTFSYAIAGLLIDLIYVLIYLGVLVIAQTGWLGNAGQIAAEQQKFINLSFGEAFGLMFGGGARAVWETLNQTFFAGTKIGETGIFTFIPGALGWILGAVGGAIFLVIFAVITLYLLIKLLFRLILSYISIILLIVIAPLQILIGALPGIKGGGFGSWLNGLLQNILVFPAVAILLLFGWVLSFNKAGPTWTPPVIGVGGEALLPLLSIGILMLANKVPDIIKSAFEGKPFPYGTAIGEALGPVTGTGKLAWGTTKKAIEGRVSRGYLEPIIGAGLTRVFGPPSEEETAAESAARRRGEQPPERGE